MALVLKKLRACDGSCCREAPRFPNEDGTDCIYHLKAGGKESSGCQLMTGTKTILDDGTKSVVSLTKDAFRVYIDTCVEWPQKNSIKEIGNTGDCCWQWVEE